MVSMVGLAFGLRGTATPRRMKASDSAGRCANTEHLYWLSSSCLPASMTLSVTCRRRSGAMA